VVFTLNVGKRTVVEKYRNQSLLSGVRVVIEAKITDFVYLKIS
jgi:hypothetical protein